jgi:hypothetical protein
MVEKIIGTTSPTYLSPLGREGEFPYFVPVKNLYLFLFANILVFTAEAQTYWQQQVDYTIDAALNDNEKTIDAFEKIVYTNNSPDTLRFIWFHLWPNAYKNDRTAFSDQLLENGNTKFYFAGKEQRGYINRLDFKADGVTVKSEDHPMHIDITKLILPKPLPPGGAITISTPFHVKLPFNFSRGGYDGQSFQVTQWYPKPAVYDRAGWHPMPYLDQGEFYSEFGSFDVRITVPENYVVAATGELQNSEEKEWLRKRSSFSLPEKRQASKLTKGLGPRRTTRPPETKPALRLVETENSRTKTLHFKQANIHDFAWFADKNFIVQSDTLQLTNRVLTVSSFYTPPHAGTWQRSLLFAKDAIRFYSAEVGEYPYNVASVVQGPASFGGGMEYPTITVISPSSLAQSLDAVIAHEVGHNWFYGILASNERAFPWMDEGLNSFYEEKYKSARYAASATGAEVLLQRKVLNKTDQAIATSSEAFTPVNYALVGYSKTVAWMRNIEQKLGKEAFRQMMQTYYQQWKFKHPQPEDFTKIVAARLGDDAGLFLSQLQMTGALHGQELKGTTLLFPLKRGAVRSYLQAPTKNLLSVSPALGFNVYDKLTVGGLLTNYGSPTARLNFLAAPLYATGSSSFTGLAKMNYRFTSNGSIRRTDVFLNASSFHMNDFKDSADKQYRMRFIKLVPGIRFTFREKNRRSTATKFIQWKTFLLNEQSLNVTTDSVFRPTDTLIHYKYSTPQKQRYLNQLQFVYQNGRALYPFDATLQVEQGQDFVRTSFTGNYFFNYAKGGGLAVRVFGGKFNYLGEKTLRKQFNNDRYYLNMTGPKGDEDYTYSDYFLGRNRFEGLPSQQIMIRDGAFKVRTDLLASKVGKTDEWLMAINFVSTVPDKLNPLSVLPFKIPLRLFADIGTYAEAWDRTNDADRFLFDAGLQLSLLQETIQVYVPLLYSGVYRNYFKSTIPDNRFFKTISFSINLNNKLLKTINREWEF